MHLCLPVGCDVTSTRLLLIEYFASKVRKTCRMTVSSKASYSRLIQDSAIFDDGSAICIGALSFLGSFIR